MMTRLAALALLLASPAFAAEPFASPWSPGAKSRARLIADDKGAGFEIALARGAITYWRNPGEAGVPPTFDFSQSENLAQAQVEFPAPERIPEPDGSVAFGYREGVVLPIAITPTDPAKPVRLVAKVNYAVCEKICLPARATAELTTAPGASPFAPALAQARAQVPEKVEPAALGAQVTAAGDKLWRLCLSQAPRELFVEPPEGYWVEPKREGDGRCYGLTVQQAPADAKPPIPLRVTIEGARAVETDVKLGG
jgi:DsbC/DsbD-like thiol-disulfide interchange protein